jgi:cell division protease FtsH
MSLLVAFLLLGLVFAWMGQRTAPTAANEIAYSEFKHLVASGQVQEVTLRGDAVHGVLRAPRALGASGQKSEHFKTRVPVMGDPGLLPLLDEHGVKVDVKPPSEGGWWSPLIIGLLPWVLLIAFYIWFLRRLSGGSWAGGVGPRGDLGKFLRPRSSVEAKKPEVTFEDVAGQENAKREVSELVEYLRNPERYRKMGAEVPHGVLLVGPPGTGKTLLARALAGEADVPFFSISASEFIEMFVGVGASRVRHLFEQAKEKAPSIIFIDELDAVGRVRGAGLGGGHDEREQTLNQILAEMDGFEGHEAVIVLAATNRPDVLDPALLRPGRFDRHVTLELPDRKARLQILQVHVRRVPLADDVDLDQVAAGCAGFSGADLKNLVNEAAMRAGREGRERVAMRDFEEMRDRVLMGSERSLALRPEEKHRLAVHESGHTLVAHRLPNTDPLYKVSIIPRGRALGGTQQLPDVERYTLPYAYLRDRLAVMLGGRTAEKVLLGDVSSGADDDIRQATALARAMVTRWGMSEDIGPMDLRESEEHPFLGREIAQPRRHSEASAKAVDDAVSKLLREAENRAREVIEGERTAMERLVAALEERETLHREDIETVLGAPIAVGQAARAARSSG